MRALVRVVIRLGEVGSRCMSHRPTLVKQVLLDLGQVYVLPFHEVMLRVLHKLREGIGCQLSMDVLRAVGLRRFVTIVYELLLELTKPLLLLITASFIDATLGVGAVSLVRSAAHVLFLTNFLLSVLGVL